MNLAYPFVYISGLIMLVDKMPTEMILISSEVVNKHVDNRNEVYWRNYDYGNNDGY
jgi:hypothetical protein